MRRTIVALVPIVGSLLFAACSDNHDTTAPRSIVPTKTISATVVLPACNNVETAEQDAPSYFPPGDPGLKLVEAMEDGLASNRTTNGFNVLARIAAVRHLANHGTAAAGGKLVLDVIACMSVGTVPLDTFDPTAALAGGIFEVRGNSEGTTANPVPAATAWNLSTGTAATPTVPLWGVEPVALWARTGAPRYLIYGYPLSADVTTDG